MFRSLHGLRLRLTLFGFEEPPPLGVLLPVADRLPVAEAGTATLEIAFTHEVIARADLDATSRHLPLFFHGRTRAFLDENAVLLTDEFSIIRVALDGGRIDARVHPESLGDGYSFGHSTMFIALMLALRAHGLFHLHAAALMVSDRKLVLIAGEGGSGKTTTTLALLADGAEYLGDDAVLVTRRGSEVAILQVPKPFHVAETTLRPFPQLRPFLGQSYRSNHDKRVLDPERAFAGRGRSTGPAPACVVFPHVEQRRDTVFLPLSQSEAMGEIIRSSALVAVSGLPKAPEHLALLRDVVADAPAFEIRLGQDMLANPRIVAEGLRKCTT